MTDIDFCVRTGRNLRATYEYERKLRMDHSESLQVMKRNYDTMVAELDKLRAELMNTANIDRGGMPFICCSIFWGF